MATTISATAAARNFSDLLARVRYRNEEFVVEKAGEEMCRILPLSSHAPRGGSTAAELARIIGKLPKPDARYSDEVERVARRQPKAPKSPWGR